MMILLILLTWFHCRMTIVLVVLLVALNLTLNIKLSY